MASLLFGSFECYGEDPTGSWTCTVLAEGTEWGSPTPIEVVVESWLRDGAVRAVQGYESATMPLQLKITGGDPLALADAEMALFAEIGKPNEIVWDPQRESAPKVVFTVESSKLDPKMRPDAEISTPPRAYYSVTVSRKAFVRSAEETIEPALAASGSTTTSVDDGSSATGWAGEVDGVATAPSVTSGAVGITTGALVGGVEIALIRTGAITTSATKYLVVDWKPGTGSGVATLEAFADGQALARVAQQPSPTAGYTRTWFYVPATSVGALRLECTTAGSLTGVPLGSSSVARSFHVDQIDRTDIKPLLGTARQLLRTIHVGGSAPAPGTLAIEHATDALGDTMVYCWPDDGSGYSPPLRPYRVSGGSPTPDSARVSGAYDNLDTALVFDVPLSRLPLGDGRPHRFLLVALMQNAGGAGATRTINWTAQTRINGTNIGSPISGSKTWSGWTISPLSNEWRVVPIDVITPQLVAVGDRSQAVVRITIVDATVDTDDINLDDAWVFDLTIGQLIACSCGTGTAAPGGPSKRLFVLSPTLADPQHRVLRGHAADGSDAFSAFLGATDLTIAEAKGRPVFNPGPLNVLTVATNAEDVSVALRYYKHWLSRTAE